MNDLSARDNPVSKSHTAGLAVVLAIVLDLVLMPRYGIAVAAAATSVAYIAVLIPDPWFYHQVAPFHLYELVVPSWEDTAFSLR